MKKTTKEQFELFKKEFLKCVDKWKITGWKIYFYHKNDQCSETVAWITKDLSAMCASVCLNTELEEWAHPSEEDLIWVAKHEAAHLLIGRFSENATARFVGKAEINEAEEDLVNRLVDILP